VNLYGSVAIQSKLSDSVIVSYSGGKESAVVLDLCHNHFKKVSVFFMFQVPGLSFQEAQLRWAEKRYCLEIYRLPHFEVSHFMRTGTFCKADPSIPNVTISDVYAHVRGVFDTHWIAAGERSKDSVVRAAMIKKSGSIDEQRGRFYPIAWWDKAQTLKYLEVNKIKFDAGKNALGRSFGKLAPQNMAALKKFFPEDYAKVEQAFPLIGASTAHHEMYANA